MIEEVMMKIPQGYKQTEIGVIPEDWNCTQTQDYIKDISMGPFGSDIKVDNFVSEGVPVLNGMNVSECKLIDKFDHFVTDAKANSLKKAVAVSGDIVITHRGTLGQVSYIPKTAKYQRYVISQSQFRVRFSDAIYPDYIVRYLLSPIGQERLLEFRGHTGVPALAQPTTNFRNLLLIIPPVEEQRRIAEALSDVDKLIVALDKKIAKKKLIKQAAMQQLLTGKKRLQGFSEEWGEIEFGQYVDVFRGGSPRPIERFLTSNIDGTNWIKIGDVSPEDKYINSATERVIKEGTKYSREVYVGDFILSNSMSFGRPYILNINGCIHDGWLVIQNYKDTFDTDFLYYLLCSDNVMKQYIAMAAGSSVKNLNKEKVATLQLYIPIDIEEQKAIAKILSDMDEEISDLESKRNKYQLLKSGMMQKLLTGQIRLNIQYI